MLRKCVILFLVLLITDVNTSPIKSRSKRHAHGPGFVQLPTYSIYLIGFFMIFLVLIIIGLIFALWRQRFNPFKRLSTQETYVKYEKSEYERQDSNEVNMRSLRKINSYDNPYTNESTLTINSAIGDVVDTPSLLQPPPRIENDTRFNPKRRNKKVPDEAIMRKEQIDEIIKSTLSKNSHDETASLRNLNELLSEANRNHYDKAASTPELDVYDVLPSPRTPVKVSSDDEYDPPVYDCPPRKKNFIIPVMDGRYVTPISPDDVETEPSYINAHIHRFKK